MRDAPLRRAATAVCLLLLALLAGAALHGRKDASGREHVATEIGAAAVAGQAEAAPAPPAWDCASLRRHARRKQRVIARHRESVASNRRWADDVSKSAFSRRRYEARAEEEARWLEKAEEDLAAFHEENRRNGVPPACLRD